MQPGGTIEINGSPRLDLRLIAFCLVPVGFIALMRPDLLDRHAYTSLRDGLVAGILALGLASLLGVFTWRAATARRPALRLSPAGFEDVRRKRPLIPWTSVLKISTLERRRKLMTISLHLDTEATVLLRRVSRAARTFRSASIAFAPGALDIEAPVLLGLFQTYRANALAEAPADIRATITAAAHDPTVELLAAAATRRPVFTYALLAVLVAVFVLQLVEATSGGRNTLGLTPTALIREGGLTRQTIAAGQYWRLLTAIFLHINLIHIVLNGIALLYAGRVLERLVGWRWYATIFALSGLAGSIVSASFVPANTVAVGASGGIVGLFAATSVLAFHYPKGVLRTRMLTEAVRVLFPTLLTIVPTYGLHTDVAAHAGGAIGGAVVGLLLLKLWSTAHHIPRAGVAVTALPVVFGLASAAALAFSVYDNSLWAAFATNLPATYGPIINQSAELYGHYPHDPRVRYARAVALYTAKKKDEAGAILQGTLDDSARAQKAPDAEHLTRALLALIQDERGDHGLAKASIAPLCGTQQASIKPILDRLCR